jgi:hypothetical protein
MSRRHVGWSPRGGRKKQLPVAKILDELIKRLPPEHAAFATLGGKCEVFALVRVHREEPNTQQYFVRLPGGEWTPIGRPYRRSTIPMRLASAIKLLGWKYTSTFARGHRDVEFPE